MDLKVVSYFDEDQQTSSHLFTLIKNQLKVADLTLQYQGTIFKISKKNGNQKQIQICIDQTNLYKTKSQLAIKSLSLVCLRMDVEGEIIRLFKNKKYIEILNNKDQNLLSTLRLKCMLSSFHEEFLVTKMIGKGSIAKVYLATKKENNKLYAIKAFNKEYMQSQHKGKESLLNEIHILRSINQKNVIRLYEVYETNNSIYFVVDLLNGGELLNRVKEKGSLKGDDLKQLMYNLI